jgi:hypothetical protein
MYRSNNFKKVEKKCNITITTEFIARRHSSGSEELVVTNYYKL